LVFSRQQVVEPRLVNPNEIVRGIERLLARVLGENVALSCQYDDTLGSIRVDPGRFEQVLMNLATNARDAMPQGGQFHIGLSRLHVEAGSVLGAEPGTYVCFTARDSGEGIPREVLDRIFEPFFTTKERGRGTGLGARAGHRLRHRQAGGWRDDRGQCRGQRNHLSRSAARAQSPGRPADPHRRGTAAGGPGTSAGGGRRTRRGQDRRAPVAAGRVRGGVGHRRA
ncbi:MAG: hypothetical protein K2Y26_06315, partial [Gemmatimonadaceae bacterium]|nr:hypothetical protein [Gemmatimonadaceae bacterium]